MTAFHPGFAAHLATGITTVCRCWSLVRRDGVTFGFTDHDRNLTFAGITFSAHSGLTAQTVQQSSGLAVDNTEALGVLSGVSVSDEDVEAGRFDGAAVTAYLVNWQDLDQRVVLFKGQIGEITRAGGAFRAELRGIADQLNQSRGTFYEPNTVGALGAADCGLDLTGPEFTTEALIEEVIGDGRYAVSELPDYDAGWFELGAFEMLSGAAIGQTSVVKNDRVTPDRREIHLWEDVRADLSVGDRVKLTAGCDGSLETFRDKFDALLDYRGFPHIPGEDWLVSYPVSGSNTSGGS